MMLPSWQDDGHIRAPALACVVARGMVVVVSGCGSLLCTTGCPPAFNCNFFKFELGFKVFNIFFGPVKS